MPQMSPLSWLALFFVFSIVFLMFNMLNYFSFTYPIKTSLIKKITKKITWKW